VGDQDDPKGSSLKEELKKAMRDNVIPFPKPKKKRTSSKTSQVTIKGDNNIVGNGNFQVTGDIVFTKPPEIKILPPPNSIGGDPLLKQAIEDRFGKLGKARAKRYPNSAYAVMFKNFKSDFGIKKDQKRTIIWTWPRECAPAIIQYLDDKYANTMPGRLEKATKREDYIHTRPYLYQLEGDLLAHFGLKTNSPEVRQMLSNYFGVSGHRGLNHLQHWQWVCYLRGEVDKLEKQGG